MKRFIIVAIAALFAFSCGESQPKVSVEDQITEYKARMSEILNIVDLDAIAEAKKAGTDAAAAAKAADDKAVAAQGEVDALEVYVGTFTSENAKTVVEYIDDWNVICQPSLVFSTL